MPDEYYSKKGELLFRENEDRSEVRYFQAIGYQPVTPTRFPAALVFEQVRQKPERVEVPE